MAYIGSNVARSFLSACRSSSLIEKVKDNVTAILQPSTNFLVRSRVTPDLLTMIGFVLNLVAATLFGLDEYRWAGLMVLVAGIFDLLDGQVARTGRTESKFGALLDSTVDRYSEIVVWFGLAVSFIRSGSLWTSSALFFALAGSLMVSYVRARAEGLGEECKIGFMQRPERVIALGVGGVVGVIGLTFAAWTIAILSNITVLERVFYVRRQQINEDGDR
ncbi:MAG: CDP-diacylglycerol--inositol 3-phosphatidyltransferase [Gemmatimonadetes bacterium]|nr:CDP-diacylglycerol--inositol 3-phosphatidyltransferase [Gemmatimonadota bacterium]